MGKLLYFGNPHLRTNKLAAQQNVATAVQARIHAQPSMLVEAQIRSMGDEQYMGEAQKQYFRALLIAQEEMLEARARASAAEIAIASAGADPVDRASAEEEHQLAIAGRARDAAQLIEIRAALKRIEADEFGWCVETGDMIGIGRLLVCPTATLCVEAQQRRESKATRQRS